MISKKIFSKTQNLLSSVVTNKMLNKDVFEKSYVRGPLMGSKTIQVLDNNSSFSNISVQNISRIYGNRSSKHFEGISLSTNSFFYKNKLNNSLKFKSYILNSLRYKNLLDSFYNSLKTLEASESKISSTLMVLKPIKGGFICYSSGVSGFLPHSHGLFLLIKTIMSITKDKLLTRRLFNLTSLVHNQNSRRIHFPLRLEFLLGKIAVYPEFKQNNFSLAPLKKKRDFLNDYNFIFLSQKFHEMKPFKKINFSSNAKIKKINKK
jgi:hypothetical protein